MSDAPGNNVHDVEPADPRASIGEQLCAARKQRKLKIESVAKELHLDVDIVKALEDDDREKLPAQIFVQGYLKSYGRLVGLPVDELIRAYSEQVGGPPPLTVIKTNTRLPAVRMQSIRLIRNVIIVSLAAILFWLAWPFAEQYINSQRESDIEQVPGRLELPPPSESTGNSP